MATTKGVRCSCLVLCALLSLSVGCARQVEDETAVEAPPAVAVPEGPTGKLLVSGSGVDLFDIYDKFVQTKLNVLRTGSEMDLREDDYVVAINGSRRQVHVKAGETTRLELGGVVVNGTGQDLYAVYNSTGQRRYQFKKTGQPIELFPGTYMVSVNNVMRRAKVRAGETAALAAGLLKVEGGEGLYEVYDGAGEKKLDFRGVERPIELLPGDYVVRVGGQEHRVQIQAGATNAVPGQS